MKRARIILALLSLSLLGGLSMAIASDDDIGYDVGECLQTPNDNGCRAGLPAAHYQMLLDEMLMLPEPNVQPLPLVEREINRFAYRRLTSEAGTTFYNAPGGQAIGSVDPGFTFVNVHSIRDGWVEINPGQWVPENVTAVTRPSRHRGVLLPEEGLRYTLAWLLIPSYPAPYPGAAQDESRERLERYTRVSIFETVEVDGWRWYLVGPDSWIRQTSVAKIVPAERPEEVKGRWVAVDLYEQVLVAYDEDTPVFATLISSGLADYPTREGTFQSYWRLENGYMTGSEGQANFYFLEGVPYTLYFDEAISMHGTYWHDNFGYRHSRGCVNLTIMDSQWIFDWTLDGGFFLPWVHVFSSGEYIAG
ncbi:MAG: L,D-transpeptidase [Anaerolineales bacterium]